MFTLTPNPNPNPIKLGPLTDVCRGGLNLTGTAKVSPKPNTTPKANVFFAYQPSDNFCGALVSW